MSVAGKFALKNRFLRLKKIKKTLIVWGTITSVMKNIKKGDSSVKDICHIAIRYRESSHK